ncbi:MAG: hypothetical protein EPN97_13745 [Alphaproteobacteria bacterium]|nr:MAG: hypothetical protein EPN97_13745 [Alphaproteobacteria bacterium]
MVMTKTILGAIAAGISIYTYVPYFIGIFKGRTKPHAFSWIIWALVTGITSAAQIVSHGGAGAWVTIIEALATSAVSIIALFKGETNITRGDKIGFGLSLSAIPLWIATGDPLWSVILVTAISVSGFWPTFRKSWPQPWGEVAQTYLLAAPAYALSITALDELNWTTALYPGVLMVANLAFGATLLLRRKHVAKP